MLKRPKKRRRHRNYRNCFYCGRRFTENGKTQRTVDHVFPKHTGGQRGLNSVFSCHECNQLKGGLHPKEWARMLNNRDGLDRFKTRLIELCPQDAVAIHQYFERLPKP